MLHVHICNDVLHLLFRTICFDSEHYKKITNSSVVVQWDTVDDVQDTNYTVTWAMANESNVTLINTEQTSYALTGLTLNTVYNINVIATNKCGQSDEFNTRVSLSESTTRISSTITTIVNHTFTIAPTVIPTSVTSVESSSTAKSSFAMVTPPTASTAVVIPVTATSDSVLPTPTTYGCISQTLSSYVYTCNLEV